MANNGMVYKWVDNVMPTTWQEGTMSSRILELSKRFPFTGTVAATSACASPGRGLGGGVNLVPEPISEPISEPAPWWMMFDDFDVDVD
jgi:hypothetical protein